MTQTTSITTEGTTTELRPDGSIRTSYPSPRITLDARGDVVSEERLSPDGRVLRRTRFGPGRRVEEEQRFTPDGALDYRIVHRHDDAGRLAEEILAFGDGTPHGRWIHHRGPDGRLERREMVAPDGSPVVTETYRYEADGRSAQVERGAIAEWRHDYDAEGWLVRRVGGPYSGDDADQDSIEYAYDGRHRLVRETEYAPDGSVARTVVIRYP